MDVSLNVVEKLQRLQIFPIVLLLGFKSVKQIKEIKDSRYSTDKISAKAAKEMYEHALKNSTDYKQYISGIYFFLFIYVYLIFNCKLKFLATISAGGNITHMSTQIKDAVEKEQRKILWVPTSAT